MLPAIRPAEVEQLLGDPTKARTLLGWNPTKTSFPELVKIMVAHDMRFVRKLKLKADIDDEGNICCLSSVVLHGNHPRGKEYPG